MFLVTIDRKTNNYAFIEITNNKLISVDDLVRYRSRGYEEYFSNETDHQKLIEQIEELLNKKG